VSIIVPPDRIVALMRERAHELLRGVSTVTLQPILERALIEAWVEGANEAFHVDDTADKLGLR
jgi:hypothetical protein